MSVTVCAVANAQTPPSLGAASNYGLLASDSIIVTDTIRVNGDAGAGTFVHSKVVADNIYTSVSSAQSALTSAKLYCSGLSGTSISGTLKNQTLTAGVYTITGNASLTDTLILSGDTTDIFIINISGNLTFNANAVILTGDLFYGVRPNNVYWNVGGKVTIGQYSNICGVYLSAGDINIQNTFMGYLCLLSQQTIHISDIQKIAVPYSYGYSIASYDLLKVLRSGCPGLGVYTCGELIDNGSFEYIDPAIGGCPMSITSGNDEWACPWTHFPAGIGINSSPDYYNTCSPGWTNVSVPNNGFGTQTPVTGSGYVGMFSGDLGPNIMEGVKQDITPAGGMIAGKVYYLELYASLAEASEGATTMGFYITTAGGTGLHWYNHPSYITSKTTWTKVSTCITATGNEALVNILNTSGWAPIFVGCILGYPYSCFFYPNQVYYYVDDVSVKRLANAGHDKDVCTSGTIGNPACSISGATYSWTAADAFTSSNSTILAPSSVSTGVNTTVNGVYTYILTVSITSGSGVCTDTDTVTVTNHSITVVASASPATVNMGSSSTLTAVATPSTGVTYSWAPGGMTGSPVVVTPPVTTVYTATATNTWGCTAQDTTIVTVVYPQCNVTINYTVPIGGANSVTTFGGAVGTPLTISNANIECLGDLTIIHTNITFSNCNFKMAAGTKILISTNCTTTVNSQTHFYACGDMWDGIYLLGATGPPNTFFNAYGSAFIEDALNGVVSQNGSPFTLNTVIFNRNRIAVQVQTYAGAYLGTVQNCIFTSRYIPSFANPASNYSVAALKGGVTPLTGFIKTSMKAPYATELSCFGVWASGVTSLTIGNTSSSTVQNIFDCLKAGVKLNNSSAAIYNNTFQYMQDTYPCSTCYSFLGGYGVHAAGTISSAYQVTIGGTLANQPNTFTDCYRGAYVDYYKTVNVKNNTFYNSVTQTFLGNTIGDQGMYIRASNTSAIVVTGNTLTNCDDAILITRVSSVTAHSLQVNTNTILANANGKTTNAIYIQDPGTVLPTASPKEIKDNIITEANYGVNLSNVKQPGFTVATNSITARYAGTGTQAGIRAFQCDKTIINNNHTKYNVTTAGLSGGNLNSYGIYAISSTNMTIKCNLMEDAGRSLAFQGGCTSLTPTYGITQNTMRRAREGFTLLASGVIGTQGNATTPSGNVWDLTAGNYFTDCHTMANSSVATSSTLYVVNATTGLATRPSVNSQLTGTAYVWTTSLVNATGSLSSCGFVPAFVLDDEPVYAEKDLSSDTNNINYLEDLANDTINLSVYSDEVNWQLDHFTYGEISNDALLLGSSDLQNFYSNQNSQPIGQFTSIDSLIMLSNFINADNINNTVSPTNTIEQNLQLYNNLFLKLMIDSNYVYAPSEVDTLYYIAEQCPVEGGPAVASSRSLLMLIEDGVIDFDDNCDAEAKVSVQQDEQLPSKIVQDSRFLIYPNPNNGNMILNYNLKHNERGNLKIHDATGRLLANFNLNNDQKQLTIGGFDLGNGIYTVAIDINGKLTHADKIIIIK